jgi:hypothetical protein
MSLRSEFDAIDLEAIRNYVRSGREEGLNLDFKTIKSPMDQDDRRNLAKALSAFANSDGGIVVWGIEARNEVAASEAPIDGLERLMADLGQFTAEGVRPTVDGVLHRAIPIDETTPGVGFVVTLIPPSDSGPHIARARENRYYKRAGSQSIVMEHFDVEDMFGRRKKPRLRIRYRIQAGPNGSAGGLAFYDVQAVIGIENVGRASAAAPYLRLRGAGPLATKPFGISVGGFPPGRSGEPLMLPLPDGESYVAKASFVVHPGPIYEVALLTGQIRDPNTRFQPTEFSDVRLEITLAAEDFRSESGTLLIPGADLTKIARARGAETTGWI